MVAGRAHPQDDTDSRDLLPDGKAPDAYRTISEVADALGLPQHVLRFWESKFSQVRPMKRAGGRRYYRPVDIDLLARIKTLLYDEGYTIKGVQRLLRQGGPGEPRPAAGHPVPSPPVVVEPPAPMAPPDSRATSESPVAASAAEPVAPAAPSPPAIDLGAPPAPEPPSPAPPAPRAEAPVAPTPRLSEDARAELTALREDLAELRDLLASKSGLNAGSGA